MKKLHSCPQVAITMILLIMEDLLLLLDGEEDYDVTIQQIEMSKSVQLPTGEKEDGPGGSEKVQLIAYCLLLLV